MDSWIVDRARSSCLSNALHSSIRQNIKSPACPVSDIQYPISGPSVKNFKWPYLSNASSDRLQVGVFSKYRLYSFV